MYKMKRTTKMKRKIDGKGVMDSSRAQVDGDPYDLPLVLEAKKVDGSSPAVEIYFCPNKP